MNGNITSCLKLFHRLRVPAAIVASSCAVSLALFKTTISSCDEKTSLQEDKKIIKTSKKNNNVDENNVKSKLIFLGTGSSTGCPKPLCTMLFQSNNLTQEQKLLKQQMAKACVVSSLASQGDPKFNKNYRNNPSLLIHYANTEKNIIFDTGKTFREGAIRWFPKYDISSLDAIIFTHEHMDAAGGLDDIRGFQRVENIQQYINNATNDNNNDNNNNDWNKIMKQNPPKRVPIPLFLSQQCHDKVQSQFPWLLPKKKQPSTNDTTNTTSISESSTDKGVKRDVACFDVTILQNYKPFCAAGLTVIPLPILHGDDLISLGFAFSITNPQTNQTTNILYLSDISKMIPETLDFIQNKLPPTDIFIVDSLLNGNQPHPVHFCIDQAVELSRQIKPRQMTYLVGMNCDSFLPHDEMNIVLKKKYGSIQLAHDGLALEF